MLCCYHLWTVLYENARYKGVLVSSAIDLNAAALKEWPEALRRQAHLRVSKEIRCEVQKPDFCL